MPNNPRDYSQVAQTGGGSSGAHTFEQRIEDVTNFAGLNVVLSFWAMADANRTLNTQFTQNFGTGGSPSSSVTTSQQANALTTSWQQFTHQIALPSIAGGTLGTDGDHFLAVQFALPQSTAFTISLANVQLELGFDATDFQRRLPGHELALCQRYFQRAGKWAPFSFDATFEGSGHFALPVPLGQKTGSERFLNRSDPVLTPSLDYADHRWYDPVVGRWISEDPLGFGGGDTNVSRYVANGATNHVDPTGLDLLTLYRYYLTHPGKGRKRHPSFFSHSRANRDRGRKRHPSFFAIAGRTAMAAG